MTLKAHRVVQWVKTPFTKLDNLILILGTYLIELTLTNCLLSSTHILYGTYAPPNIHINNHL